MQRYFDFSDWYWWDFVFIPKRRTALDDVTEFDLDLFWDYHRKLVERVALERKVNLHVDAVIQDIFLVLYKWKMPKIRQESDNEVERHIIKQVKEIVSKLGDVEKLRQTTRLKARVTAEFIVQLFKRSKGLNEITQEDVKEALQEAEKALQEIEEAIRRIASLFGTNEKGVQRYLSSHTIEKLIERTDFLRILDILDLRFNDQPFRRKKKGAQTVGIDGVTTGETLPPLPSEIALDEILEDYLDRKFAEKSLLVFEKEQEEDIPNLIFVLDESGSMEDDDKIYIAKALFLKLFSLAFRKRRNIAYIGFDSVSRIRMMLTKTMYREILNDNSRFSTQFENTLLSFSGGGTNFSAAVKDINYIIDTYPEFANSEVIFITDGRDNEESTEEGIEPLEKINLVLLEDTYEWLLKENHWILRYAKTITKDFAEIYEVLKERF